MAGDISFVLMNRSRYMNKKRKTILITMLLCCILCTGCKKEKIISLPVLENIEKTAITALEKDCKMLSIVQEKDEEILRLLFEANEFKREDAKYQRVEEISVPTEEEIKTYLNMTIEEIEKLTGITIDDDGTLMIFGFAALFPCLYLEDSSFYFVCYDYDKTQNPRYLSFYGGYDEEYLSTIGLSYTMNFKEIEKVWGEGELMVNQTGKEEYDRHRYMLTFRRNGLRYDFVSDNPEGNNFDFYIALTKYNIEQ